MSATHHNTDLWRAAAPIDGPAWGMWPSGGAWLCLQLWDHYQFSGDKQYLASVYPVLKGAALFLLDTLVEEPKHKWLVTNPSISPENQHPFGSSVCAGPTMDEQIIRDLFSNTIQAAELLGLDEGLRQQLATARARLAPNQAGKAGQLQIDGNFGGASGIAEMLLQSHAGEIELLPAFPKAWPNGKVQGLRARGGFEVEIAWANGRLARAVVRSVTGKRCVGRYGENKQEQSGESGSPVWDPAGLRSLLTVPWAGKHRASTPGNV